MAAAARSAPDRATYAYELHRQAFAPKETRSVQSFDVDDTFTADHWVLNAPDLVAANRGYVGALVMEDCFSRYAWAVPQKSLTAAETWRAFSGTLHRSGRVPRQLWVDQGSAFLGSAFSVPAAAAGIQVYHTYGPSKAAMAERLIKTLGANVWRKLTELDSDSWIDVLLSVVDAYNHTVHSSLGMTPIEASRPENATTILRRQAADRAAQPRHKPQFRVGEWVRISRAKGTFEKSRGESWTTELFRITGLRGNAPPVYSIVDAHRERIDGTFYEAEMQRSSFTPTSQAALLRASTREGEHPDDVVQVLRWREDTKDKRKFARFHVLLRYRDGTTGERSVQDFVGKLDKKGAFVPTSRGAEYVLPPLGDYLQSVPRLRDQVWDKI